MSRLPSDTLQYQSCVQFFFIGESDKYKYTDITKPISDKDQMLK